MLKQLEFLTNNPPSIIIMHHHYNNTLNFPSCPIEDETLPVIILRAGDRPTRTTVGSYDGNTVVISANGPPGLNTLTLDYVNEHPDHEHMVGKVNIVELPDTEFSSLFPRLQEPIIEPDYVDTTKTLTGDVFVEELDPEDENPAELSIDEEYELVLRQLQLHPDEVELYDELTDLLANYPYVGQNKFEELVLPYMIADPAIDQRLQLLNLEYLDPVDMPEHPAVTRALEMKKVDRKLAQIKKHKKRQKKVKKPESVATPWGETPVIKDWSRLDDLNEFETAFSTLVATAGNSSLLNSNALLVMQALTRGQDVRIGQFVQQPTARNLFNIVQQLNPLAPPEETFAMDYNFDAVNYSFYIEDTSSNGRILTLEDSPMMAKQKFKIQPTSDLAPPPTHHYKEDFINERLGPLIKDLGLHTVQKPFQLPKLLAPNQNEDAFPLYTAKVAENTIHKVPNLPDVNDVMVAQVLVPGVYYPRYRRSNPDFDLLFAARAVIVTTTKDPARVAAVYSAAHRLRDVMSKHMYCGGSMEGQLGRFKAVANQFANCKAARGRNTYRQRTVAETITLLQKRWPYHKTTSRLHGPLTLMVADAGNMMNNFGGFSPWLITEPEADAGLAYARGSAVVTRQMSKWADLDMADGILEFLSVKNADLSNLDWLRVSKMKNKPEVYSIEQLKTKTRNIGVQNAGATNLGKVMFKAAFNTPKDSEDSWSILGWSPFYGGIQDAIDRIKRTKVLVYSDNFWAVAEGTDGHDYWISCDGVKNEASVTKNDAIAVGTYAMSLVDADPSWTRYAKELFPVLACDSVMQFGNVQFYNPWLASGSPGTMYCNHVGSLDFVDRLLQVSRGKIRFNPETKTIIGADKASQLSARFYTVERVVRMDALVDQGVEHELDLLGFSCIAGSQFGVDCLLPILDSDRMYKAIAFLKKDILVDEESGKLSLAINFFRYRVFYVLGGWADPGLSSILLTRCGAIKRKLKDVNLHTDLSGVLNQVLASLNLSMIDDRDGLLKFSATFTVPTVYDVFQLLLPPDQISKFVDWTFTKSVAPPWAYLPIEVFLGEAEARDYAPRPSKVVWADDDEPVLLDRVEDFDIFREFRAWKPRKAEPRVGSGKVTTKAGANKPEVQSWFARLPQEKRKEFAVLLAPEIKRVLPPPYAWDISSQGHPGRLLALEASRVLRTPVNILLYAMGSNEIKAANKDSPLRTKFDPGKVNKYLKSRAYKSFRTETSDYHSPKGVP